MIVYSICVTGSSDCVSDRFSAHSKEIYINRPKQEQIDAFIERCCTGSLINLNKKLPYNVHIIEHPLIEE